MKDIFEYKFQALSKLRTQLGLPNHSTCKFPETDYNHLLESTAKDINSLCNKAVLSELSEEYQNKINQLESDHALEVNKLVSSIDELTGLSNG